MGNKETKDNIISNCPTCRVPFTKYNETALSVTINNKVYTVHQHGENIVVSRFHHKIICSYSSEFFDNTSVPMGINSSRLNHVSERDLIIMTKEIFISENIIKYFLINTQFTKNNIPLDIIPILINIWYNKI